MVGEENDIFYSMMTFEHDMRRNPSKSITRMLVASMIDN